MPAVLKVVNDRPVIRVGESTAEAARQARFAAMDRALTEISAGTAEALVGPSYATEQAGLDATEEGKAFAVNDGGVVTIYEKEAGASVRPRVMITKPALVSSDPDKGAGIPAYNAAAQYVPGTVGAKLRERISVLDFGAVGDGLTDDSPAFDDAVAALDPVRGGEILIPQGYLFALDTPIFTGTTPVVWVIEGDLLLPPGDHGLVLQANGSHVRCSGTVKLRPPATPMVLPTVTPALTDGVVTSVTVTGGSGIKTCPVLRVGKSPASALMGNPDAGIIATPTDPINGGTITAIVVAGGNGYTEAPPVEIYGGGQAAVYVDNVQNCTVTGLACDYSSVPGSVGVYRRGGWWGHDRDNYSIYNTSNGVPTESPTTLGMMIDSYTLGSPGATGGFGGVYVCTFTNIRCGKIGAVGHDTSTATTLSFNRCDVPTSFIHATVDTAINGPVKQQTAESGLPMLHLVNVDGVKIDAGDFELSATHFEFVGSCNHIRLNGTQSSAAKGPKFRGMAGVGSRFEYADSTGDLEPLWLGGPGTTGIAFQNTGWRQKHRIAVSYVGNECVVHQSNIKLSGADGGVLDDPTIDGVAMVYRSGGYSFRIGYAGSGSVPVSEFARLDATGMSIASGGLNVAGARVVGTQGDPIADPTDAASTQAATIAILNFLRGWGSIRT